VHLVHGEPERALGSFALNVGVPVTGALVGYAARSCTRDSWFPCGMGEAAVGFLLGMLAAPIIDIAALGGPRVDRARETAPLQPTVSTLHRADGTVAGLTFGVSGGF
jgi:hypothetical protein